MANVVSFTHSRPLVLADIERPLALLSEGILNGKVRVVDEGSYWSLLHPKHFSGDPVPGLSLEDDGRLTWRHVPGDVDTWLLHCVGCQVVRSIDPDGMLEDEGFEGAFPADFDRRYPTLKSYVERKRGWPVFDALNKVLSFVSRDPDDGIRMGAGPF